MSDITDSLVVANALQLFTASRSFKALADGKIYVGEPDTDPTIPSNQKTVYLHNEDGTVVPIPQPVMINMGGHAVYNGQLILKLSTEGNYSMAIYNAYGSQEYYFDNMSHYDPDVLLSMLSGHDGSGIIGYGESDVGDTLYHTPEEFLTGTMNDAYASSLAASAGDGKRTWIKGDKVVSAAFTVPDNTIVQHDGKTDSSFNGSGTGEIGDYTFNIGNNSSVHGGRINNVGKAGVATVRNKSNVSITGVVSQGSVTADNPFAYALDIRSSNGVYITNSHMKGYTGAISMIGTEKTIIDGLHVDDMYYHAGVDAGGYGVVSGGSNDTIISKMLYKAKDGDNGRHGVYLAVQGGNGNNNTIITQSVFDYRQKSDAFRGGAINIRANARAIINGVIIDGSTITGNIEQGDVYHNLVIGNIIKSWIYDGQVTGQALNIGDSTGGFNVIGSPVIANIVNMQPKDAGATGQIYGIAVTGKNRVYSNNTIDIPALGYPFRVQEGAQHILIANNIEYTSTNTGGQAFILFDGPCSDITVTGNKTSRPMFRNITNCTDLTVDFPRYCQIVVNSGVVTISSDDYSLISGTEVNEYGIIINFNSHVTQAALDTAIALNTLNFTPPSTPVIATRGTKNLNIRFYNSSGALINPITGSVAIRVQIFR
ncbi:hypothetical protein FNO56_02820 [Escherichia coli]|nr:hypothetical protein [Escherichia coli]HDX5491897.1 hypothetical protein [Escherichia coli]